MLFKAGQISLTKSKTLSPLLYFKSHSKVAFILDLLFCYTYESESEISLTDYYC